MYNVLIVDDEAPAREILKLKVDWESIGCRISGMAKNGQEALDFYTENKPDLVITDIQMPVMGGLELIKAIKAIDENQPIIILSCHETFSFARKAIQLGVHDYLIKDSFDTEELYTTITEIFKSIDGKELVSSEVSNSYDKQKSSILKTLIFNPINADLQESYIQRYHLNLIGNQFIMLYLDIEILDQDISDLAKPQLSHDDIHTIQDILRMNLQDYALGEVCHTDSNTFLVIYNVTKSYSETETRRESINIATGLRQSINSHFNIQTTIGISSIFNSLDNLERAYNQGQQSVQRKIISGYDKSYIYNSITNVDEDQYIKILNVKLKRVSEYLESHKYEPVVKEIKDIFLQNLKGFMQYNYLKHTNWTLLSMFIEYCSKNNISFIEIFDSRSPWETVMNIKTVDGMCQWFVNAVHEMNNKLKPSNDNNYSYHVQKSIVFIDKHYSENISLSDLSDKLDINNAYLSRIFKKETGNSITDYINNVRIEEAKSLIQNTNKKMYEIAEQTGFSSTQRFFLIFKKVVGSSPGDFRKT